VTAKTFRPEQARIVADAFEKHGVDYLFIGPVDRISKKAYVRHMPAI